MSFKIKTLILAAGEGKRMKSDIPKVLTPIHGKALIVHLIDSIKGSGVTDMPVIIVGQKRDLVMKTLGNDYQYVIQEEQKGTGHAVMMAKEALINKAENIMVLYGDHPFVSAETIKKLTEKHLGSHATITMATVKLQDFKDWRSVFFNNFSRIIRDDNGGIVKDVQFKDASDEEKETLEINPCYFCFEGVWLWNKLKTLNTNNSQKEYYLTDLIKLAIQEKLDIESIDIDPHEALGGNSQEELQILEKLTTH